MDLKTERVAGLTLIELMVAMAVLAVTVTLAVPSFQDVLARTRATTAYHQLTASLMLARMAAISLRQPVVMCPSADGLQCRSDLIWEDGWIVFPDPGHKGQPDGADALLRRVDRLGGPLQVRSSRGRPQVRYRPDGRAPGSNLSLHVCQGEQLLLAKVVVNNVGRARTELATPGDRCDPTDA